MKVNGTAHSVEFALKKIVARLVVCARHLQQSRAPRRLCAPFTAIESASSSARAIDSNREGVDSLTEGGIGKYPFVNGYEVWRREGNGVGSRFFRNLIPDKIITDISLNEGEEVPVLDEEGNPVLIETGEYEEVVVLFLP